MSIQRIYGVILRYTYYFLRSYNRLSDVFYWPIIDLFIWGLTSSYLRTYAPKNAQVILVIVSGLLFWIMTWRGQYEITVNLLTELWDKNLINIFVTPLKFSEWMVSVIIVGIIKSTISFVFALGVAFAMYKINVFSQGILFIPLLFLLLMSGWWIGFFTAGLILRLGSKWETLAWSAVWLIAPFSAIFYPVSVLPDWAQKVAHLMPTSYVFEAMRQAIYTGHYDIKPLLFSLVVNAILVILSVIYILRSYKKVLNRGLISVY